MDIAKILADYKEKGIRILAKENKLTYKELRELLERNGVKISRGRKRGSGIGQCTTPNGKKVDRRKAWQLRRMEAGECTSCGKPNDSDSIYHCEQCLNDRTEAKRK